MKSKTKLFDLFIVALLFLALVIIIPKSDTNKRKNIKTVKSSINMLENEKTKKDSLNVNNLEDLTWFISED